MNYTPLILPYFCHIARRTDSWGEKGADIQTDTLRSLLRRGASSEPGRKFGFADIASAPDPYAEFKRRVPSAGYEDIRADVMRMIHGEKDVLWPGRCRDYAQSSGTSGGRSKFIPITGDSLRRCHYKGAADTVAHYLRENPNSRIFSGKAFVLGGSFANQLGISDSRIHIGDLSATLIQKINPLANLFRVPDKHTALIPDWMEKLPALVKASAYQDITNLSGVPSWFLTVIKEVMKLRGTDSISDVWPHLEVFFHGGISFEPYREIYTSITNPEKMHFRETYNASEGFFAVQNEEADRAMLLIIDNDIFYEFLDISTPGSDPVSVEDLRAGGVYELIITSSNGLWRYHLGDTVRVVSLNPVKITIAGRTKTFINAFGEELMEENAEHAIAAACRRLGCTVSNYTAAPVYATGGKRGRHQWLVEWDKAPTSTEEFAMVLDEELRKVNSDYDAKRQHTIFLDPPEVISIAPGSFNRWLRSVGTGKLGGQRKIPRLSNSREIADAILSTL